MAFSRTNFICIVIIIIIIIIIINNPLYFTVLLMTRNELTGTRADLFKFSLTETRGDCMISDSLQFMRLACGRDFHRYSCHFTLRRPQMLLNPHKVSAAFESKDMPPTFVPFSVALLTVEHII
jgi:hypothetical protein